MGIASVQNAASAGGMADVTTRIAAIQSRIESLVGTQRGAAPLVEGSAGDGAPRTTFATAQAGALQALQPDTLAAKLPERGRAWAPAIAAAATKHGVDPTLLASLVQHESGFDPGAVSHAGAIGLAQLMPGTAAGMGVDPHDPQQNLEGGARFLRAQLDRFGAVDLALAAYNAGPNRVAQAGGVPRIPETMAYVDRVTATWEQIR